MKIKYSKKKIFIILGIFLVAFFIIRPLLFPKKNTKETSTQVSKGELIKVLTISGKIDAEEKVSLMFQAGGRLAWVGVKEGDYVQKYQSIASLDQRQMQKTLQKYLEDYLKYRDTFDQTAKDDYKDKAITDAIKRTIEKSQSDLDKSVLDVEIQNLSIEFANLWTPIEGIVTHVSSPYAGINVYLPTQAQFDIVNPKSIYFSASADQNEVSEIKENTSAQLVLDSFPETTIAGQIRNISFIPKTGETGTVYEVKFYFSQDNTDYKYKIGMAGDLNIITDKKENVLYVPLLYLKEEDGKKYVNIKKNNKIEKKYIQTGLETDENIEIVSGLVENETIYD